jgi:hypothetical protein
MYDTIAAGVDLPHSLDERTFQDGETRIRQGRTIIRMWHNDPKNGVRVTYWRTQGISQTRLRAEFSIPHTLGLGFENPTHGQSLQAITDISLYMNALVNVHLPHIREWKTARIDYAWNWDCGADLPMYLALVQRLSPSGMSRTPYPDSGVVFKSGEKHGRWLKFYDKGKQLGILDRHVLRYEVSNYKRVLPRMAESWYGCTRKVGDLLHPGRALFCMAAMWDRLGLSHAHSYGDDEASLLVRMRRDFGSSAPGAYYALMCIRAYGAETHKSLGLMNSNTYYTYRRKLTEHNYMIDTQYHMPSLALPYDVVMNEQTFAAAQDLGRGAAGSANRSEKILREKLGVRPQTRLPKYLQREVRRNVA